jgi:hypothetical protein
MPELIKLVDYYYTQVEDLPGAGRRILEHISEHGVNMTAFNAFPVGEGITQLDFIVEDVEMLKQAVSDAGVKLTGPKKVFLIQGDDRVGAMYEHYLKLANAGISVLSSNGVIDGKGRFGFVLWVDQKLVNKAARALAIY